MSNNTAFITASVAKDLDPKIGFGEVAAGIVFSSLALFAVLGVVGEYSGAFGNGKPALHLSEDLSTKEHDESVVNSKSKLGLFFLSFSPARNLRKIFWSPHNDKDDLTILNGIRVLAMFWVMIGHAQFMVLVSPSVNPTRFMTLMNTFMWCIMPGGFFAVDIFFFLSAFLGAYLMLDKLYGKTKGINLFMLYFHRYYRLIWSIIFLMLFACFVYPHLGDGPAWA